MLHAVANGVYIVLGLNDRDGQVWLVVEDVVRPLLLAARVHLAAHDDAALGVGDFSRIWVVKSQPACCKAGVMYCVQMSRSESVFLDSYYIYQQLELILIPLYQVRITALKSLLNKLVLQSKRAWHRCKQYSGGSKNGCFKERPAAIVHASRKHILALAAKIWSQSQAVTGLINFP